MSVQTKVLSIGQSTLTGWRGSVGRAVARPIARRTRFSEQQIAGVIGLLLLLWASSSTVRRVARGLRAA